MAKKENREGIALQCTACKNINYLTSKNKKKNKKFQWFASQKKYWQNLKHM